MRPTPLVPAALVLCISGPSFAQEWIEFASRADRFTCNFPVQPTVTETTYRSEYGADLPARVYSATQGQSRYSVRVVDYNQAQRILTEKAKNCPVGAETCAGAPGNEGYSRNDVRGALVYASWQFLQRDAVVTHYMWNAIDRVEGHQLQLTNNADKSRTFASIYMHENRLYIAEASVPAGYPEPGFFQQSLGWLDENGRGIRYDSIYSNGFPPPPRAGRGQGQGRGNQGPIAAPAADGSQRDPAR
jgi:hypothetical protein